MKDEKHRARRRGVSAPYVCICMRARVHARLFKQAAAHISNSSLVRTGEE